MNWNRRPEKLIRELHTFMQNNYRNELNWAEPSSTSIHQQTNIVDKKWSQACKEWKRFVWISFKMLILFVVGIFEYFFMALFHYIYSVIPCYLPCKTNDSNSMSRSKVIHFNEIKTKANRTERQRSIRLNDSKIDEKKKK